MIARTRRAFGYCLLGVSCGPISWFTISIGRSYGFLPTMDGFMGVRTEPGSAPVISVWDEVLHWLIYDGPVSLWPGFIFGLVVGGLLWTSGRLDLHRAMIFAAASTLAHGLAHALGFDTIHLLDETGYRHTRALAGFLGGGMLAGVAALLMPELRRLRPLLVLTATGTVFGVSLMPMLTHGEIVLEVFFLPLWQGAYAGAFGAVLPNVAGTRPV